MQIETDFNLRMIPCTHSVDFVKSYNILYV